jgi:hypothetical protein
MGEAHSGDSLGITRKERNDMLSSRKVWLAVLGLVALALVSSPARAVEPDKWIPGDANAVIVFNVRQTLDSPLVKTYALKELQGALKQDDKVEAMLKSAGLDPLKDVDSVMMTVSDISGKNEALIVVHGKFNLDKVHAAAEDFAKKNPTELKFTGEGKTRIYEKTTQDKSAYAALPDANTVLVANDKDFLQSALKKDNTAKVNKELQSALEKVKGGKESLWGVAVVTDDVRKSLAGNDNTKELAPKLDSVTGSLNVSEDMKMAILIHTTDAAAAKKIAGQLNTLKPFLSLAGGQDERAKPYIDLIVENLKITSKEKVANIDLQLTADQLKKAAAPESDK